MPLRASLFLPNFNFSMPSHLAFWSRRKPTTGRMSPVLVVYTVCVTTYTSMVYCVEHTGLFLWRTPIRWPVNLLFVGQAINSSKSRKFTSLTDFLLRFSGPNSTGHTHRVSHHLEVWHRTVRDVMVSVQEDGESADRLWRCSTKEPDVPERTFMVVSHARFRK